MNDKYARAITYLKKHPKQIISAWACPFVHPAGCLFQFAAGQFKENDSRIFGCLTQIRGYSELYYAETRRLTRLIAKDERIPRDEQEIRLKHLPVFAEWQRRLDKELKRSA